MCYYRYYYYGACRHCKVMLHKHCDEAKAKMVACPAKKSQQPQHEQNQDQDPPSSDSESHDDQPEGSGGGHTGKGKGKGKEKATSAAGPPAPSSSPTPSSSSPTTQTTTHRTTASSLSIGSSVPTSFASIQEESPEDLASLSSQQQSPRRHSEASSPKDMASLASFSTNTFKHLMMGSKPPQVANPVTTTRNHDDRDDMKPDLNQQGGSFRIRQPGIRETDESCDLPSSNDILQHIAGSRFDSHHIGTDGYPEHSYDTEVSKQEYWRSVHNEIDAVRDEVRRLEAEDASGGPSLRPQYEANVDKNQTLRSPRTKIPAPMSPARESAAARLQRQHEKLQQEQEAVNARLKEMEKSTVAGLPSSTAADFPELGLPSQPSSRTSPVGRDQRRMSYASMAGSGMLEYIGKNYPGSSTNNGSDVASTDSSSRTGRGSFSSSNVARSQNKHQQYDDDESSVIISPASTETQLPEASPAQSIKTAPGSPTKQSPRFAQPTKSFARRAGETLRKDSVTATSKIVPETSPNRSVRTITQRQPKRKSLPGGWINSPEISPSKDSSPSVSGQTSSPSPERRHVVDSGLSLASKTAPTADVKPAPERELRKKTSSYMSPTKSTARRNFETLGQENVKQSPPRLAKTVTRINTHVSPVKMTSSPATSSGPSSSCTLTSASTMSDGEKMEEFQMAQLIAARQLLGDMSNMTSRGAGSRLSSNATSIATQKAPNPTPSQVSRRSTIGSPNAEDIMAAKTRAAGLPLVANTTTKRRGSHGSILTPIRARLARVGVLHGQSPPPIQEHPEIQQITPSSTAMAAVFDKIQQHTVPSHPGPSATPKTQPDTVQFKCVPPHRKKSVSGPSGPTNQSIVPAAKQRQRTSETASLRATAQEFRPMMQPQTLQQEVSQLSSGGHLDYYPYDQWSEMSFETQKSIHHLRKVQKANGGLAATATIPGGYKSPSKIHSKAGDQASQPDSFQHQVSAQQPQQLQVDAFHHKTPPAQQRPAASSISNSTPRPTAEPGIETGAMLKPELDPVTNTIQWMREGVNGVKEPVFFGRAAAPEVGFAGISDLSPTSDDTSPRAVAGSPPQGPFTTLSQGNYGTPTQPPGAPHQRDERLWRVGSLMNHKYGWKGGDGKEISFTGCGADAERDPKAPINVEYGYKTSKQSSIGNGPRMTGGWKQERDGGDDGSDSPPLAPRSRQQWAKFLAASKACSEINISSAYEMLPHPGASTWGQCNTCVPGH